MNTIEKNNSNKYQSAVSVLSKYKRVIKSIFPAVISIGMGFMCADAVAQDDALATVAENVKGVITLGLQLMLAVVFLIVAWAIVSKFNDARRGRADWGEVVVPFVVGAAVVILIVYLQDAGITAAGEITGTAGGGE